MPERPWPSALLGTSEWLVASGESRREAEEAKGAEEPDGARQRPRADCAGGVWGDSLSSIPRLLSLVVFAGVTNVAWRRRFGSCTSGQKRTGF